VNIGTGVAPIIVAYLNQARRKANDDAGMLMKDRHDKRRHRRLRLHFDVACRNVGSAASKSYGGRAVNVSSGGLYFETVGPVERGDLLKVVLEIPPTAGLLEFGGKLAGYANVLRAEKLRAGRAGTDPACEKYGVAVQFCHPPKLCL
jgi:hypothetical protein